MPSVIRLVHPAPAAAVVLLSLVLGALLSVQAGRGATDARVLLVALAVLGSQIMTGALNDWADRERDAAVQASKPIPSGAISPRGALIVALAGFALQLGASVPLGPLPLMLGVAASASAVAYDLWLSRTVLSFLPYLVSFGLLPLWIASGVGASLERVAAAPLLVGPFAVAAHLANTVRDFDQDARIGSGNLSQRIGRRAAFVGAWGIAMVVGIGVGIAFGVAGRLETVSVVLGLAGLAAVGQGLRGPGPLWAGLLVAAVTWTAAWALATG
ncbi:MAG: UbiA family prenyltransferase [Chloroflexi bacterium]|nr:UbiA family prenyltransferase [Chloroflexota bacterium]